MSVPAYFLNGSKHQKPVFVNEDKSFFIFRLHRVNKIENSIAYNCHNKKLNCYAKAYKLTDGTYSLKDKHSCQGLSESKILIKITIEEIKNKVFPFLLFFHNLIY